MDKDEILNKLIDKRIGTFLGYEDPKSKIWFIGMEEGGLPMDKDGNLEKNKKNIGNAFEHYHELFRENKTFEDIKNSDYGVYWGGKFHMLY